MPVDITRPSSGDYLSLQELALYQAITSYRASLGLTALPLSAALTTTAGRHVLDTRENIWAEGVTLPAGADLHSWSDGFYYSDHRDPSVMWTAPARVGTDYPTSGYEISAAGFADVEGALQGWINSPSHNAILTGTGVWEGIPLRAIGIGVDTSPGAGIYAGRIFHVWFGETADPATPTIVGTNDNDAVVLTAFADKFYGLNGDDDISGGYGDDTLFGGNGNDLIRGEYGFDLIYGGEGDDRIWGSFGGDTIFGGGGNDAIAGGYGADRISGGAGNDFIAGGRGGDWLIGDEGADLFAINDVLESQASETLRDTIADFTSGEDVIRLSLIDGDAATPGRDPLRYIGAAQFTGAAGELRMSQGLVEADVTGDGIADMQIVVLGADVLPETDFLL